MPFEVSDERAVRINQSHEPELKGARLDDQCTVVTLLPKQLEVARISRRNA